MRKRQASRGERGVAMLLCLFALMILTSIGLGLMYMSTMETSINSNFRASLEAYYAAKAGMEEGRDRIRYGFANYSIAPPKGAPATNNANGVIYILNPSSAADPVAPWDPNNKYFDDELCHENFPLLGLVNPGANVKCSVTPGSPCLGSWCTTTPSKDPNTGTASAMAYKWVRITLKFNQSVSPYCADATCAAPSQICADSSNPNAINEVPMVVGSTMNGVVVTNTTTCDQVNLKPVYMVTSLAVNLAGARRMTQYEVAQVTLPNLPGAMTVDGPVASSNMGMPNSGSIAFNGNDHGSAAECSNPVGNAEPGVGSIGNPSNGNIISAIPSQKTGDYTGAGGTTPNVQQVPTHQLGPYSTIGNLNLLVQNVTGVADQVFPNPTAALPTTLGTDASPLITVVNGNYDIGNLTGSGILLVTGNLTGHGNPTFHGVVLVIGNGDFCIQGGGQGTWYGGLLIANTQTDSLGNSPGLPGNPPGTPNFCWSGGGTATVQYDSCFISGFGNHAVYRVLASREEMY